MRSTHWPCSTAGMALALLVVAGQPAWAGKKCDAPPETWQARSAVAALAERQGWQIDRLKVDDGCYEIKGRDAQGRRIKAKIDPASLQVIAVKREHGDGAQERVRQHLPSPPASAPSGPLHPASGGRPG